MLGAVGRLRDEAPVRDGDVGAAELPRADVDEAVLEEEAQLPAGAAAGGGTGARPSSASLTMS